MPRERLRLVCFPHAGAFTNPFRALGKELAPVVEVVPVEYPGHGGRMEEPLAATMTELVAALRSEMGPKLGVPYAFLGHSLGALVAFAFARDLVRRGETGPCALFVSSSAGPWEQRDTFAPDLDDARLLDLVRSYNGTPGPILDDVEFLQAFLPALRFDFALAAGYRPARDAKVAVPIVAVGGEGDPHVDAAALSSWAEATTSTFEAALVPGDHFHVSAPSQLAGIIRRVVTPV